LGIESSLGSRLPGTLDWKRDGRQKWVQDTDREAGELGMLCSSRRMDLLGELNSADILEEKKRKEESVDKQEI